MIALIPVVAAIMAALGHNIKIRDSMEDTIKDGTFDAFDGNEPCSSYLVNKTIIQRC